MAMVPENVIQYVIQKGLQEARDNDFVVNSLLRNIPEEEIENIKQIFRNTEISMFLGFSRAAIETKVPSISVILSSEDEVHSVLGDLLGEGTLPDIAGQPGGCTTDEIRPVVRSGIPGQVWYDPDGEDDPDPSYKTSPSEASYGYPRKLIPLPEDGEVADLWRNEGSFYSVSHTLLIITQSELFTLFLYALCKMIVYRNKMLFETNEMINISLSGTDLLNIGEAVPDFVWSRGMVMKYQNLFNYFYKVDKAAEGYASSVNITIYPTTQSENQSTGECEDVTGTIEVARAEFVALTVTPSIMLKGPATLIITGTHIHYGATVEFDDMKFNGISGIEILETSYINGNRLEVDVLAYNIGTTDVTVKNPDFKTSTIENGLVVT